MPEREKLTLVEYGRRVLRAMGALGAPYAIGGGFAVNAWVAKEMIRPTIDFDLHAKLSDEQIARLCELLRAESIEALHSTDMRLGSGRIEIRRVLCLPDTVLDLLACDEPYGGAALEHRVKTTFEGVPAFVLAPEDLILHKALAGRDQDWIDVAHLVSTLGEDLDRAYIERWARALRVWSKLRKRLGPSSA